MLPGRLLSGWGWGVSAAPRPAGSDAGSATGTRPHWDDPGTGLRSDCSPQTHLETHEHESSGYKVHHSPVKIGLLGPPQGPGHSVQCVNVKMIR